MNVELKVENLEGARKTLKAKNAELRRRMMVRDSYFDKERHSKNEIIRLRNLNIVFPSKTTRATLSYEQNPESYSTSVSDFDDAYDIMKNIFGKPFIDIVWFGETYHFGNCKIELRSVRNSFDYIVAYGKDKEVLEALKKLDLDAELLENGAIELLAKG